MVVGSIMANVAIFQGESSVMFTSYVPMMAAPHFYLGIILFAVGALIGTAACSSAPWWSPSATRPTPDRFRW
jgi:heme/copper-type cytochrome/quinol oxidase subunit 1